MKTSRSKPGINAGWLNGLAASLILAFLLGACTPAATPAPTAPAPTLAPTLTNTPAPTATIALTPTPADTPTPEASPTPAQIVLIGAGDIVNCDGAGGKATANLLAQFPGATIFTAGDNIDHLGTPKEFKNCFGPTWGRYKDRIHPAVGEMEYNMKNAYAYFDYFGAAAGEARNGYYSYDVGGWHVVVLNSECARVGGCEAGSAQEKWLKQDLADHPAQCSIAIWHMPRFHAALAEGLPLFKDFWKDLYEAGVELVVNAHQHYYMRYAPLDPNGQPDDARGIQEFIVGTGGAIPLAKGERTCSGNCQVYNNKTFGLLKLTLHPDSYEWAFVPEPGKALDDAGSRECH
jgi:acid phosphatase type 7